MRSPHLATGAYAFAKLKWGHEERYKGRHEDMCPGDPAYIVRWGLKEHSIKDGWKWSGKAGWGYIAECPE